MGFPDGYSATKCRTCLLLLTPSWKEPGLSLKVGSVSSFEKKKKRLLRASGLKLKAKSPLNWNKFHLPSRPEKLRERLNLELDNVRFRLTYSSV